MLIGLFDQDMLLTKCSFFPSLELMKYSAYYKEKQHIVHMLQSANDVGPYDKIILHKSASKDNMPTVLLQNPKVEWIGKSFYGGQVILPPDDINQMRPDKSIYEAYFYQHEKEYGVRNALFIKKMLVNGLPVRLTYKGQSLYDKPPYISDKFLFMYDEDFCQCEDPVSILLPYQDKSIFFIYPQYTNDWNKFIRLCTETPIRQFKNDATITYEGPIDKQQFVKYFSVFCTKFRIGFRGKKENELTETMVMKELLEKGNYFFYSLAHNRNLLIGGRTGIHPLLFYFSSYTFITGKNSDITFKEYVCPRNKQLYQEVFKWEQKYPILYPIFNSRNKNVSKGGYWQL